MSEDFGDFDSSESDDQPMTQITQPEPFNQPIGIQFLAFSGIYFWTIFNLFNLFFSITK